MEKAQGSAVALSVREERIAQGMLFDPWSSVEALLTYEEELLCTPQYAVMIEKYPQRAAKQIGRHLRKPAFAALSNCAFTAVLHDIVPKLEQGEALCPEPNTAPFTISPHHSVQTRDGLPFTGSAAAYLWAMTDILSKGWDTVVNQLLEPDSPCTPIWRAFEGAQQMCKYAQPFYTGSPHEQCDLIAQDNGIVSLELLTHLRTDWAEGRFKYGGIPTAENTTRWALKNADHLAWGASANVNALGRFIHTDRLSELFDVAERTHPADYPDVIANRHKIVATNDAICPRLEYAQRSLKNGPWEHEQLCPAPITLIMPSAIDQKIMRRFGDYCKSVLEPHTTQPAKREGHPEDLALINRATLLLEIGALIGRETIFKNWSGGFNDQGIIVTPTINGV